MPKSCFSIMMVTVIIIGVINCSDENSETVGNLNILAYGEDFINNGFTDKDGWDIEFDHVYIMLGRVTACQGERIEVQANLLTKSAMLHTGHGDGEADCTVHAHWDGFQLVDLTMDEVSLTTVPNVSIGKYQSMTYYIVNGLTANITEQDMTDYSLKMIGTATKESSSIEFTISAAFEMKYADCGMKWYDEDDNLVDNSGIVTEASAGDMQITIHIDHIFGDIDNPELDDLAIGFEAFATLDTDNDGIINVTDNDLSAEDRERFLEAAKTVGHVGGEGECSLSEL